MTETEWLTCTDPALLLQAVNEAGDRKMRLFACACCRHIWDHLGEPEREAVLVAERYADGETTAPLADLWRPLPAFTCASIASCPAVPFSRVAHYMVDGQCSNFNRHSALPILRDLFGNPFRCPALNRQVLAWHDGCVLRLAHTAYEERAFDTLPVLADALEDAGCDSGDILAHLRGPGPHFRGCFVLDWLLEKA